MLKIVRIVTCFLFLSPAFGQVNMFDILERTYLLDLDRASYPELEFEWNFDGKVQASMNAALTELIDNKDYARALKEFDDALQRMPSLAPAFYYRGVCRKMLDSLAQAKFDLMTAASLRPGSPEILLELGEVYELEYNYAAAEKCYQEALNKSPGFAAAYFNLANMNMRQTSYAQAARNFRRCLEADSTFIEAHVRQGLLALATSRRPEKTIEYFTNALAVDSSFQAALFWRGLMFLRDENVEKCLKDWNKLVVYNPENPMFILLRAFLYLELKVYDKAFLDLKLLFSRTYDEQEGFQPGLSILDRRLDLQFAVSYINRTIYGLQDEPQDLIRTGFCLLAMDRCRDAVVTFQRSYNQETSSLSLFLTALAYEHWGKPDSAFVFYDKALASDPDIFDAHKKRGYYYALRKDWPKAHKDFEDMIRLEPTTTTTYGIRADIRVQYQDYYGAIIDLTRFIELDSTQAEVYELRGDCRKHAKDFRGANSDYRKALELNPRSYQLYVSVVNSDLIVADTIHALQTILKCDEELGLRTDLFFIRVRVYIHQKKFSEAREELKQMKERKAFRAAFEDPELSELYFLEGWIDCLENKHDDALRNLNKAISYQETNHEALYLRSKVFIARNDKSKAIRDLKILAAVGYQNAQALLDDLQ